MNKEEIKKIIEPQNGIEEAICADADFITGASYGKPRHGHPEGQVIYHIEEVLGNIDRFYNNDEDRSDLRLIAIMHDTFKNKVNQNLPKSGENHHGAIARRFAQKYINDYKICKVIELHDEAYNAWSMGDRRGDWYKAKRRAETLIDTLELLGCLDLYVKFYRCDNATGNNTSDNYTWFVEQLIKF
jgi:hypothetical protein